MLTRNDLAVVLYFMIATWINGEKLEFKIKENTPINSYVGRISDGEYTLMNNNFFELKNGKEIIVSGLIDRDDNRDLCIDSNYPKVCRWKSIVSDIKGNYLPISITILDENDNPPSWNEELLTLEISENEVVNRYFDLPAAFDPDYGDNSIVSYELTPADNSHFTLEYTKGSTPKLRLINKLDREQKEKYEFSLIASDGSSPFHRGLLKIIIIVTDENDNAPTFLTSYYTAFLHEDSTQGSLVPLRPILQNKSIPIDKYIGRVTAFDKDSGLNGQIRFSFAISTPTMIRKTFYLEPKTGSLSVIAQLNYEKGPRNWAFSIIAHDHGQPQLTGTTTVNISLINSSNHPPDIELQIHEGENSMIIITEGTIPPNNTSLATIKVTERDEGSAGEFICNLINTPNLADVFSFRLTGKIENIALFNIYHEGIIDREEIDELIIRIICTDEGTPKLSSELEILVKVQDVNDNAPIFKNSEIKISTLEEMDPSKLIACLEVVDRDVGRNEELRFNIVPFQSQKLPPIKIDKTGGIYATSRLDREAYPDGFKFIVIARDGGEPELSSSTTVSLELIDINDNFPIFEKKSYIFEIEEEDTNQRRELGHIRAIDKDKQENAQITYEIDEPKGKFRIDSDGLVYVAGSLDREARANYVLQVVARDRHDTNIKPLESITTLYVKVLDRNDNSPIFINAKSLQNITISHKEREGSFIKKIDVFDYDDGANGQIDLSLMSLDKDRNIVKTIQKNLILARNLTREDVGVYTISIIAQDRGIQPNQETLTIHITVDDSEPVLSRQHTELNDGAVNDGDIILDNLPINSKQNSIFSFNNIFKGIVYLATSLILILFLVVALFLASKFIKKKRRISQKVPKPYEQQCQNNSPIISDHGSTRMTLLSRNLQKTSLHDLINMQLNTNTVKEPNTSTPNFISIPNSYSIYPICSPSSSCCNENIYTTHVHGQNIVVNDERGYQFLTTNSDSSVNPNQIPLNIQFVHDIT